MPSAREAPHVLDLHPSLLGINLLFWGLAMTTDGAPWSTTVVLLALGVAFMTVWVWMVRREGRR